MTALRYITTAALLAVAVPLTVLSVVFYAGLRAWEERK